VIRIKKGGAIMRSAVVYYSLTGNTGLVSKMIAERLGADLIKLQPDKEVPESGAKKYLIGSKSVMLNEKPKLLNEDLNLEGYDTLIIGTPIWARSYVPAVNTFLSEYVIKDKNIYIFTLHGPGMKTEPCYAKMKEKLTRNIIKGTADFEDVKKMSAKELDDKVRKFCRMIIE
jgi:flavodoxin